MIPESVLKQIEDELNDGFEPTLHEAKMLVAEIRRLYVAYAQVKNEYEYESSPLKSISHWMMLVHAFDPEGYKE